MAVEFEEPGVSVSMRRPVEQGGSLTKFFIATGLAKSARDAQVIMIVVALLALGISAYVFFTSSLSGSTVTPLTPEQLHQISEERAIRR